MRAITLNEPWREPSLGACACSQLRKTARTISALYDHALAEVDLTVTQYAILVSIARTEGISRTALAAKLGMDRTTLTRNLRPLEREKLIAEVPGDDRREKLLQTTASGKKRLNRAYPLWERVQKSFFAEFGRERFEKLSTSLAEASEAATSIR